MRNNNNEPLTAVWQNGGFGAKMKVSASKSATFAKPQNVTCKRS